MFTNIANRGGGLFDDFRRLQREMDQLFSASPMPSGIRALGREAYPPINIGSTEEQVDVYLFAAGVDPRSLDISIQQNLLTLAGERKLDTETGVNYYRKERFNGAFRRVVTLPEDVDPDKVQAKYQDGVLHVTLQRRESSRPRKIEVQ
ncbi:heat-shock protein Hsp20 [Candidatus Tenderia electrophaga]|jgi:HSP20 family protein|uniref:Heat-shock protein Hsp20 n=1 Tax=Candidatus Tenderia electrophaga TaxID=1748243 RepID=A0A0S2TDR0_9GAMM|nr:heat-shock protein Hsp20 [Candidatus Tenderia electrophaga]